MVAQVYGNSAFHHRVDIPPKIQADKLAEQREDALVLPRAVAIVSLEDARDVLVGLDMRVAAPLDIFLMHRAGKHRAAKPDRAISQQPERHAFVRVPAIRTVDRTPAGVAP